MIFLVIMAAALTWALPVPSPTPDVEEYKTYWKSFKLHIEAPVDEKPFKEFQQSFLRGEEPPIFAFETDQILVGECISRLDPQRRISSSALLLVRSEQVFGKRVYLMQNYSETGATPAGNPELRKLNASNHVRLKSTTMLRPLQAAGYSNETIENLSEALLFSAREAINPITLEKYPTKQHFMVRHERPGFFRTILGRRLGTLWVAQLCSDRGGCFCPVRKCYGSAMLGAPVHICSYKMSEAINLMDPLD